MRQKTITTAGRWALQFRDIVKGAILAVMATTVPPILELINKGDFSFDWKAIGTTALGAFMAYVLKKFLEPAKEITFLDK